MSPTANPPAVSVVLPTHNRSELLLEAIDSLLKQTRSDWEAIVVDDASTPPAVVPDDPRIRIARHESGKGGAACKNIGIAHARAPVLALRLGLEAVLGERGRVGVAVPADHERALAVQARECLYEPREIFVRLPEIDAEDHARRSIARRARGDGGQRGEAVVNARGFFLGDAEALRPASARR